MTDSPQEPLRFKFHWLNESGQQTSMFRKQGQFDGETLTLEEVDIPAVVIANIELRDNRMLVTAVAETGEPAHLPIQFPSKKVAGKLKSAMDNARSKFWAQQHREELAKRGREHEFRVSDCPHCGATIVLSNMPETPQLFCSFCQRLTTITPDGKRPKGEGQLRLCDECGMYSQPRKFTIGYIVFLLVFVYYNYRQTWRCPACMRGDAWKMLFGNLPTLLGTPVALVGLYRSYSGGGVSGSFKGLDTGNIKARKGDFPGALGHYRAILQRVPNCAGVKYNLGLALRQQNKLEQAADSFRIALEDCANYAPAYAHLVDLYEQLGMATELEQLQLQWEDPVPEEDHPVTNSDETG